MGPRTRTGSAELGAAIRERRASLGLSVQEIAARAGITSKTWASYEAGASIREDKVRGLCKALGWRQLPGPEQQLGDGDRDWLKDVGDEHRAWSVALEEQFGRSCGVAFAVGSDIVSDHAQEDLVALERLPRGTHLGQLDASWLSDSLPRQFVPRYDYEFVYALASAVATLRTRFAAGALVAHSVLEEIALYLIFSETEVLADMHPEFFNDDDDWHEWLEDILGDLDLEHLLFQSGRLLTPRIAYHFDHWLADQFWTEGSELSSEERNAELLGLLARLPTGHESDVARNDQE